MADVPNARLAGLIAVIGEADTRELVGLFLDSFGPLMRDLSAADPVVSLRAAHSLKSSSSQMGASHLASRMAELEGRLRQPGAVVSAEDLKAAAADFAAAEAELRSFAKPATT